MLMEVGLVVMALYSDPRFNPESRLVDAMFRVGLQTLIIIIIYVIHVSKNPMK